MTRLGPSAIADLPRRGALLGSTLGSVPNSVPGPAFGSVFGSLIFLLLASGCARHQPPVVIASAAAPVLPAPTPPEAPVANAPAPGALPPTAKATSPEKSPPADSPGDAALVAAGTPIYSETGKASWYGPPYNRRKGANGQIYNQDAMTAAHRTLPMNSLLRVTNIQTGQSAIMRVTDRGPFVPDRVLDLSLASARAVGVYLPGTAQVRIEVFETPAPIAQGGRWCVQIGAIQSEREAKKIEAHLQKKYTTANVIEFTGPTGHWVRIRPANDDKQRALEIASKDRPSAGNAYLVRLD
ncbi:septal ring lytic transglycosylase RlpA family protein [Acidisarcina polymorpha]|uniref:septal ring lytic transglycosylase RlpA family protein n=1 Tax=Acidisarcina polymorpha TaxID=2211140 RepID=UPI001F02AB04|nr:septal ring lytic transglycosylase RlpA family protein [Acidisarcina polymorpha]